MGRAQEQISCCIVTQASLRQGRDNQGLPRGLPWEVAEDLRYKEGRASCKAGFKGGRDL